MTSGEFVRGFVPPEYLLDGIMMCGYLYSFTGPTAHGKTLIGLQMAMAVGYAGKFGNASCRVGRVGYFALENAFDIRMRWIALCHHHGINPESVNVYFSRDDIKLADVMTGVMAEAQRIGGFKLVIIDTGSVLFAGDDINQDVDMIAFATKLRELTRKLNACVVAMMHPIKNANQDSLIPKGGGGFLNQVDGNFTCWNSAGTIEFHWQGKLRGPSFEPILWDIVPVTCDLLKEGRQISSVVASPLDDLAAERKSSEAWRDQEKVLQALASKPGISIAKIARRYGWVSETDMPNTAKVHRILQGLERDKLTKNLRGKWRITDAGKAEIKVEPATNEAAQ